MEKEFMKTLREIEEGVYQLTTRIAHVEYYMLDKQPYSFHLYAVYERNGKNVLTEMLYDLRNKRYYILRNGKEVKFSVANLDTIIPRQKDHTYYHKEKAFEQRESIKEFFDMVSVEENAGMYEAMIRSIGSMGEERVDMSSRALIRLITEYNKLELLYKAGVDLRIFSQSEFAQKVYEASRDDVRKIHQIFGLTKSQYKFMNEMYEGNYYFAGKKLRAIASLEQRDMDFYRGFVQYIKDLEGKYNEEGRLQAFDNSNNVSAYIDAVHAKRQELGMHNRDFYNFIFKHNHTNPLKLIEYLLFECYVSQGIEISVSLSHYRDYYRMCSDLEYERFDRYPKYLKTAHDIVARNYNLVQDKVHNAKFAKNTAMYKSFEATFGDFAIVVPDEAIHLVNEGNVLQHCVGSYVRGIAEGNTQIMFLREKDKKDEPLVTVEVRGDEIVQARGQANRPPTTEERDALVRFAKRKQLKIKSLV